MRSPVSQSSGYCLTIRKASQSLALAILLVAGSSGGLVPTLTAIASLSSTPASASDLTVAQDFSPPDDWSGSGQREGGSTRGGLVIQGTSVVALIPASNLGTTLSPQPTLFFYIPIEAAGLEAELVVLNEQEDVMYQAIAPLPSQQGIVSMDLPPSANLEAGRRYQWYFSIIVSPDDPSSNLVLNGWVQRQPVEPTLTQQINATPPEERPALYRQFGIWYEALGSLAELRRANPDDAGLQAQWIGLLESVGLGAIADQPLLGDLLVSESGRSPIASTRTNPPPTPPTASPAISALPASPSTEPLTLPSDLSVASPDVTTTPLQGGFYVPSDVQLPTIRIAGSMIISRPLIHLVPLIPTNHIGLTQAPNPTVFLYIADNVENDFARLEELAGEFTLLTEDWSQELYRVVVTLPSQPGITSIALPPSMTLEPGQNYRWAFEVIVEPEDRSMSIVADGLIQRRLLTPEQLQQLETVSLEERPVLYGQWSFWYDALSLLADLRRANPEDANLQRWWNSLLTSAERADLIGQPLLAPMSIRSLQAPSAPDASAETVPPSSSRISPDPVTSPSSPTRGETPRGFYTPPDGGGPPGTREGGGTR